VRSNISIGLQYVDSWLQGMGAAGIRNLMEDAATAEISRSQLWQWIQNGASMEDGRRISLDLYREFRDQELTALGGPGCDRRRISSIPWCSARSSCRS
jgi:malate synthase